MFYVVPQRVRDEEPHRFFLTQFNNSCPVLSYLYIIITIKRRNLRWRTGFQDFTTSRLSQEMRSATLRFIPMYWDSDWSKRLSISMIPEHIIFILEMNQGHRARS